jgi:hypothetical protein
LACGRPAGLAALAESHQQLWGGWMHHPQRLWAPSPGHRLPVAGTAPPAWGRNTTGILKIKGLETVAWPRQPGAGQGQTGTMGGCWALGAARPPGLPGQGGPVSPPQ